jgi:hypothetical protein
MAMTLRGAADSATARSAGSVPVGLDFLLRRRALAIAALLLAPVFLATVALPLATYTSVLALFGLAHVGSELRYIDHRFGSRLRGGFGLWIGMSLVLAVTARLTAMSGVLPAALAVSLEVAIGAGMAGVCLLPLRSHRLPAAIVALSLFAGAVLAPFETLLVLAIAHNVTPLAFLADALEGAARRRVLAPMAVGFLGLPLLIATGLPYRLLAHFGLVAPEATLFGAGPLDANLGAYVPSSLIYSDWALPVFSASVFAQCMHYVAVIGILPRLIEEKAPRSRPLLPWPGAMRFALCLAGVAIALALGFAVDYKQARQVYALAALVHSWIEIPILILALDRTGHSPQAIPSA